MQNMESMSYVNITDGNAVLGWPQQFASMEQAANAHPSSSYVMNVIKPEQTQAQTQQQQRVQQQQHHQSSPSMTSSTPGNAAALSSSSTGAGAGGGAASAAAQQQQQQQANPSVITATYNPTYNRCLPKILSDLDCEMKIKQVLKCIENILLDGNELDQQQSYKLPDRSSSPQLKRIKVKEDEEMHSPSPSSSTPSSHQQTHNHSASGVASTNGKSAPKNPVRINVKVEPSSETASTAEKHHNRTMLGMYTTDQQQSSSSPHHHSHQVPSSASAGAGGAGGRGQQVYDMTSAAAANRMAAQQQQSAVAAAAASFNKAAAASNAARAYSFEPFNFPGANAAQFMHQPLTPQQQQQLQAQQTQLLMHMATQQQMHQQLQQQLLNNGIHVLPHLNNNNNMSSLQHLQFPSSPAQSHPQAAQGIAAHVPQYHDHAQSQHGSQVPDNTFASIQMDEFPFPVFSNTILEEVSQYKREEHKKEGEESVFFFGNPAGQGSMYYTQQTPSQSQSQSQSHSHSHSHSQQSDQAGQADGSQHTQQQQQQQQQQQHQQQQQDQQVRTPNPLGASLSQLHPFLLQQMPQLSGLPGVLEEDDKWILSLLNIDGHENNNNALTSAPPAGL